MFGSEEVRINQTLGPAPRFVPERSACKSLRFIRENCLVDVLAAFERRAFSPSQADLASTFLFGF